MHVIRCTKYSAVSVTRNMKVFVSVLCEVWWSAQTAQHTALYRAPQTATTTFTDTLATNFHLRSSRRRKKLSYMLKNQESGRDTETKTKEQDR